MIVWPLLVGVLLVAVLHRLDLAVDATAWSQSQTEKEGAGPSAGEPETPGLSDPGHLSVPTAPGLAARTRPHVLTPVSVAQQLLLRLFPRKLRFTLVRRH